MLACLNGVGKMKKLWEITFVSSGGGESVHVIDKLDFLQAVEETEHAADFFDQSVVQINIKVLED